MSNTNVIPSVGGFCVIIKNKILERFIAENCLKLNSHKKKYSQKTNQSGDIYNERKNAMRMKNY